MSLHNIVETLVADIASAEKEKARYGSSIAAIAGERYSTFADLLTKVTIRTTDVDESVQGFALYPDSVIEQRDAQRLPWKRPAVHSSK